VLMGRSVICEFYCRVLIGFLGERVVVSGGFIFLWIRIQQHAVAA